MRSPLFPATALMLLVSTALIAPIAAKAQSCTPDQIFAVIDQTGARLRQINAAGEPRARATLLEIARKRGWADADIDLNGRKLVADQRTRELDAEAGQLLDRLSRLGDNEQSNAPVCARLAEAKTTAAKLIEVTTARSAHVSQTLAAALAPAKAAPPQKKVAAPPQKKVAAPPQKKVAAPPKKVAPPSPPASALAKPPNVASWGDATVRRPRLPPEVMAALPRPIEPADLAFTSTDIQAAGRGLFGSISAGLASVIDYAFSTYGRPTGYILGTEGGGAFLAGLRYGEGRLVTKLGGERKVFWQGPTVGYDVGVTGSRVMFLVYNLRQHDQLFTRFLGVDGSAYLVGGVGITFLKRGPLVLAPIRTGLGLRLGANVGYLKFTPKPSLNPF